MTEFNINYLKQLFGNNFKYEKEQCLVWFPGNQFATIKYSFEVCDITFCSYDFNLCMYFFKNNQNPKTLRFIIKSMDRFSISSSIMDKDCFGIYLYDLIELLIREKLNKLKGFDGKRL